MTTFRLLTYSACENLLNYKSDPEIRKQYNDSALFVTEGEYLSSTISMNLDQSELTFGTKSTDDLESSIKLFTALKEIDLVQANDKRLWVTLTHTLFFDYVRERWNITQETSDEAIKDRFHFEGAGLRARNQNAIARLWWAAKITYDENRSDPFELTKILWNKQDFYQNLIDRKLSTYPATLKGFINFFSKNTHLDLKKEMRKLFKGINAFGGVRVLSLLSEEEVKEQILVLCKFYNIQANVA